MPRQHFGRLWAALYLVISLLLSSSAALPDKADYQSVQGSQASSNSTLSTRTLVIKLYSERTGTLLHRQAMSKLTNLDDNSAVWQISNDNSEIVFASIGDGKYEIEVSAIGHTPFRRDLEVTKSSEMEIEIVLQKDTALTGSDLSDVIVSPKTRKLIKQSINLLKSEKLTQAQKQLDQAYKLAPNSADVNFLLGYLYFRQKDFAKARTHLDAVAKLNPRNAQALTLLGRTHLEREDLPAALSTLQQAILLDFENWLPHNLLATAYFREGNYDKARDEAEIALRNGKRAASASQLILGESLFEAGHSREAVEALNVFLEESPQHPMAGQLRNLVAKINEQLAVPSESTAQPATLFSDINPLAAVPPPALPAASWQPPGVDEIKPPTAPGVNCPFGQVMERTGKSVEQLVQDVGRFAAVEDLLHQNVDNYGIPVRTQTRKYNYVAAISETALGMLNVDEYRSERLTLEGYPDKIASTGFVTLALVFHPRMSETFTMACEGLGDWNGQASWLVHFRQRDDRPNYMHNYKAGNQNRPVGLKGRAWIKADTFQIVRIEAEMVDPAPDIQLMSEHQIVDYGPVPFANKHTTVWLPKTAQIYFDLRKHRYYRRHTFEHYMLYSVDTDEKRKEPTPMPPQSGF